MTEKNITIMNIKPNIFAVHDSHCCPEHGCKYGDPDCPVMDGLASGVTCEDCDDEQQDLLREQLRIVNLENEPRARYEEKETKKLGDVIGYGRMMQLAEQLWRKKLEEDDMGGGEFVSGPCKALTVPCGCKSGCDWCEGAEWLTKKVKDIKNEMTRV